ncbi:hypothetical protein LUX29_21570 [Aureimonas altamirensis]|uniref:hypothetical protein n=1 Tax=Aureimonas altamirensis TaxID=370622 RepID=UPI001E2A6F99|nr:hypothetical protein [Aureimonas altamirensis]UHD45544.1 hypothetical protein LUX29_21570 [Aureimonas altamirensis]
MEKRLQEIRDRILALAEIRRRAGVSAYYLSQLGGDLDDTDRAAIESLTGKKLIDFVRDELNFRLAKRGTAYFIHFEDAVPPVKKRPRYRIEVWDAFVSPLAKGFKRTIDNGSVRFEDVPVGSPVGGRHVIPRSSILQSGEDIVADVVSSRIGQWLVDTEQDPQSYLAFPEKPSKPLEWDKHTHSGRTAEIGKQAEIHTLWDLIISSLSAEDIKRINMPVDVVEKLRKVVVR